MLGLQTSPHPNARDLAPRELDLISAARRGDISAFNQLVRTYQELAYRLAFHVLDDANAAEDATQRAFENAYRQIGQWNGEPFKNWLLGLVIQQCKRARRAGKHTGNALAQSPVEMGLAILSPEERMICVLADVLGLPEDEVAQITHAAVRRVRAIRSRARWQIRDLMQINGAAVRSASLVG